MPPQQERNENPPANSPELPTYIKWVVDTYKWIITNPKDAFIILATLVLIHYFILVAFNVNLVERGLVYLNLTKEKKTC